MRSKITTTPQIFKVFTKKRHLSLELRCLCTNHTILDLNLSICQVQILLTKFVNL